MRYRTTTKYLHRLILFFKLDNFFASIARYSPFFTKFIPSHLIYKSGKKNIKRDKTYFEIDPSDYMQWHIFSNVKDLAWKKAVEAVAKSKFATPVIIDVGSNVGAFSLKAACNVPSEKSASIFAFDPNPYIKEKFLKNLSLNKTSFENTHFILAAVGSEEKEIEFSFSKSNSGGGKVEGSNENLFLTKLVTLDSFVEHNNLEDICFLKIDVEGYEPFVFEGARKLIQKFRPVIYFEVTEEWHKSYGKSVATCIEFLNHLNYDILADENGKEKVISDLSEYTKRVWQTNLIAYPKL